MHILYKLLAVLPVGQATVFRLLRMIWWFLPCTDNMLHQWEWIWLGEIDCRRNLQFLDPQVITHCTDQREITSVVQDTILKTVSYVFMIQDSILSGKIRYLFIVSYLSIFKMLFEGILGKWKILFPRYCTLPKSPFCHF